MPGKLTPIPEEEPIVYRRSHRVNNTGECCMACCCPCATYGQVLAELDPLGRRVFSPGCCVWLGLAGATAGLCQIPFLGHYIATTQGGMVLSACCVPNYGCHLPLRVKTLGEKEGELCFVSCLEVTFCCPCSLVTLKYWATDADVVFDSWLGVLCPLLGGPLVQRSHVEEAKPILVNSMSLS